MGGAVIGGLGGGGYGVYQGYTLSKDWLTNCADACAPAKQEQKTSFLLEAPAKTATFANGKVSFG